MRVYTTTELINVLEEIPDNPAQLPYEVFQAGLKCVDRPLLVDFVKKMVRHIKQYVLKRDDMREFCAARTRLTIDSTDRQFLIDLVKFLDSYKVEPESTVLRVEEAPEAPKNFAFRGETCAQ